MIEGLKRCGTLLERYGGHQAAAGLSVAAAQIDAFRSQLEAAAREMISEEQLQPTLRACAEITLADVTPGLLDDLEQLEPFGPGNPTPVFVARRLRLQCRPQVVGRGHLKLWLTDGDVSLDAIRFNAEGWLPAGECVDAAFTPQWNEYQGKRTIQLKLADVRDSA